MNAAERLTLKRRYRGVVWQKYQRKWRAYLHLPKSMQGRFKSNPLHIGFYGTELEAAIAHNDIARDLFGTNAELNVLPAEMAAEPDPPTPEEIEQLCRSIRDGWTERDYRSRAPHWVHANSFVRHFDGSSPYTGE